MQGSRHRVPAAVARTHGTHGVSSGSSGSGSGAAGRCGAGGTRCTVWAWGPRCFVLLRVFNVPLTGFPHSKQPLPSSCPRLRRGWAPKGRPTRSEPCFLSTLPLLSYCETCNSPNPCPPPLPFPQSAIEALLGPKTEADLAPPEPKKKEKPPPQPKVRTVHGMPYAVCRTALSGRNYVVGCLEATRSATCTYKRHEARGAATRQGLSEQGVECSGCGAGIKESRTSRQVGKCHSLPYGIPEQDDLAEAMVPRRRVCTEHGCSVHECSMQHVHYYTCRLAERLSGRLLDVRYRSHATR